MKTSDVITKYHELYGDTIERIERLNRLYCIEFNECRPKLYNNGACEFYIANSDYVLLCGVNEMNSGISLMEMKSVSLQTHFNYLAVVSRAIEDEILKRIIPKLAILEWQSITHFNLVIKYFSENNVAKVSVYKIGEDDKAKDFCDLESEEQIEIYHHVINK